VSRGDAAETTRLIDNGADVNAVSDHHTPIWYALTADHPNCARILLEHGANVNVPNANGGASLLMLLANERFGSIAPELPEKDQEGEQAAVAKLLLQRGADVKATDANGDTALMWAAAHGQDALVSELLAAGAPADTRDRLGQSALVFAAAGGSDSIVKTLLAHGAGRSGDLPTAVKVAKNLHHADIVKLLIAKGKAP
jgi:ankyrin repeat protein